MLIVSWISIAMSLLVVVYLTDSYNSYCAYYEETTQ